MKVEITVAEKLAKIISQIDALTEEANVLKEEFRRSHKEGDIVYVEKYDKKVCYSEGSSKTVLDMKVLKKQLSRRVFKKILSIKAEDIKNELPKEEAAIIISAATVITGYNKSSIKVTKMSAADRKKVLKESKEEIIA